MNNKNKESVNIKGREKKQVVNYEKKGYQPTLDTRPIKIPKGGSGNSGPK
ncbi:hypothetical protein [Clostridium novyi]|nr:hypothetical protein [Clostridium novyi]